jgi:hypothetical protein
LTNLNDSITIIPTNFCIRLPTNDQVVNNAAGNPHAINTFDGPSN